MSASGATAVASTLVIRVNDEPRTIPAGTTVADLVRELGLTDRKGVAIALNGAVVPRSLWPTHSLADGDRLLLIRATQGG